MNPPDETLVEAWALFLEDHTDEVEDRFEQLLPTLIAAGYAETNAFGWSFTEKGVARAEELIPED